jgi:protein-S-isoprenylcysteine O-methyltransferase Ste14
MRVALLIIGLLCILTTGGFLLFWAGIDWLFRDGMGPDSMSSSGLAAWSRFWSQFRDPFYYCFPIIIFGVGCVCVYWMTGRKNLHKTKDTA